METRTTHREAGGRRSFFRAVWRGCLTPAILLLALAALASALVLHSMDEAIRRHVEKHFAAQFPHLAVTVRSARRVVGQGIEIRGLSIRDPSADESRRELVYIDEVLAVCPTGFEQLLRGDLQVRRLEFRRPRIHAVRSVDGRWNLGRLLPLPDLGDCKPPAVIEDAALEIQDLGNPAAGSFTVRQVNLTVTPSDASAAVEGSSAEPSVDRLLIVGSLVSDHFRRVELRGEVDPIGGAWSARGHVAELEMSSRLLAALPGELASQLSPLATLRARADLDFTMARSEDGKPPRFEISGRLAEGRFDDARLPYPLTDLQADVYCDSQGLRIDNLRARSGRTTLQLAFDGRGFEKDSPFTLRATARQLPLDRRLYETLPADWRESWDRYSLGGTVNVDAVVRFDGRRLVPDVIVECRDLSFAIDDFSYPMRQGRGTIRLRDKTLSTDDFEARAGAHRVHIRGRVEQPGPEWTGWLEAGGEGSVPIDETLLSALDEGAAKTLRALRPTGMVRLVHARHERTRSDGDTRQEVELELRDVTIAFEGFPYPIHRIEGKVYQQDGHWNFRDLVGRNDTAYIVCDGRWTPYPDQGGRLTLEFDCRSVPLEDELKQALEAGGQQLWANLRPRGTIDQLGISLALDTRRDHLELDVRAQQWPPRENVPGRSLSLFPTYFPYRMDNLTGAVRYRDGRVEIQDLQAVHGRTQIRMSGQFESPREGPWSLQFSELTADALHPDRDLIAALPEGLGQALSGMQLKGLMSVRGTPSSDEANRPVALQFRGGGPDNEPVRAAWSLAFDIENGSLQGGLDLEHVRGGLSLVGWSDEQGARSRGELSIDSAMVEGVHVTRIRGPLWLDSSRLVLGTPAVGGPRREPPRPVTGRVFGGELVLGGEAAFQGQRSFAVEVAIADADLAEISREMMPRQRKLTGRAMAKLTLRGQAQRPHTYLGNGAVRLRNADIYEVPVMVALLKLLSVRRPDTTAFTSSDIEFRVQGEDIYFDPIDFRGDAISLIGKGWMDLDQNIQLTFYTQVGRREFPLLGSVLAEASRNILEIQVVGTLNEPVVQQTAFPELDDTLQLLFPDTRRRVARTPDWFRSSGKPPATKTPSQAPPLKGSP